MASRAAELGFRWTARRGALAAAVAILVLTGLVVLGRWERRREIDEQLRGMAAIQALVGRLDSPTLSGYRVLPGFDCLVYRRGSNPFALELCVDRAGRLVEAIDRRRPERRIYSLRFEPDASRIRVDRAEVDRLLRRMHAPRR